jgi:hypothetical protein
VRATTRTVLRAVGSIAAVLVAVLVAGACLAAPAQAAPPPWALSPAAARSGTVTMAKLATSFVAVTGGGTGGATYTVSKSLNLPSTSYVDVRSASTVATRLTGTVALDTFGITSVTISACTSAWAGGSCPGTTTTVISTILPASSNVVWTNAVGAGAAVNLKVAVGGTIANRVTLTVATAATRAAGNRSTTP